jgi:hypothetical protein
MHPLDRQSTEMAVALAPIDCDAHTLTRVIALFSLAAAALVARFTDQLETVAQGITETEEAQAADDVTTLLDIAHRWSMEAGPRELTDEDVKGLMEKLEEYERENDNEE